MHRNSNLIKAQDVNYVAPGMLPAMVQLEIPIIDTGDDLEKRRRKWLEEIDELLNEVSSGEIERHAALSELLDVIRTGVGYIFAYQRQYQPLNDAADHTVHIFAGANVMHLTKMKNKGAERGWRVISP